MLRRKRANPTQHKLLFLLIKNPSSFTTLLSYSDYATNSSFITTGHFILCFQSSTPSFICCIKIWVVFLFGYFFVSSTVPYRIGLRTLAPLTLYLDGSYFLFYLLFLDKALLGKDFGGKSTIITSRLFLVYFYYLSHHDCVIRFFIGFFASFLFTSRIIISFSLVSLMSSFWLNTLGVVLLYACVCGTLK